MNANVATTERWRKFGFNMEDVSQGVNTDAWRNPAMLRLLTQLHPQFLRFGGTPAMWIDWQTGQFYDVADLPAPFRQSMQHRTGLTLADYSRIIRRTGALPVFDLNMATSSLGHELALLRAARRLGLPIRRIELGNELYDPAYPRYVRRFPDGAAYGGVANQWIAALHKEFPNAQLGVSMWNDASPITPSMPLRVRDWNRQVLATVRGESALVFHPYWQIDSNIVPGSVASAEPSLQSPVDQWQRVKALDLSLLPAGTTAWLSEWNLAMWPYLGRGVTPHQNWAQALGAAWFAVATASDPRVSMALYHDVVSADATAVIQYRSQHPVAFELTASGTAMATIFGEVKPATFWHRVPLAASQNLVHPIAIQNPSRSRTTVVINPSATPLVNSTSTSFGAGNRADARCRVRSLTSAIHTVFNPKSPQTTLPTLNDATTLCTQVAMPPYSVNIVTQVP